MAEAGAAPKTSTPAFQKLTEEQLATWTPEQKDRWWYENVYQGDRMPQLTFRAVLTGGILGMLMAASNLYTTLTVGWSFGVVVTASVMSYVIWTVMHSIFGGRKMSMLETNCMASTASAAGYSTGSTIATMFGALVLLQEGNSETIETMKLHPWWLLGIFTLLTGLMGVFLAIPMKRQMVNHEQLAFPTGIAAAETIKSLYSESKEAMQKAYVLIVGLVLGGLIGILNTGRDTLKILDKFYDLVPFLDLSGHYPEHGFYKVNNKELIGFGVEKSLLLIAAGMIVGLRVCLSMLVGSAILYFVVGPWLIAQDFPHLQADGKTWETGYVPSIEIVGGGQIYHLYRWGLWGGTALMVMSSLTALGLQWKTIARAFKKPTGQQPAGSAEADAGMRAIEVPFSWMVIGMVPIAIGMVALQVVAFSISWWAGCIAVAMSFVLSMVASRATGETDTTPIGAMGKVMQLLFALLHPGQVRPNLAAAGIAANSAIGSADLLTDLKSGYLLGANPRRQFLAQFIGVFFGTLAIVPIWYLMVPTKAVLEKFPSPGTQTWAKVAQVLTKGLDFLPMSAKWAILIGGILGIALPVIEKHLVPAKYRKYFPSASGLGLSWVVPFANSVSFTIGAIIAWIWTKVNPKSCEKFNVPLASGMIAGEGLIKAVIAMSATAIGLLNSPANPTPPAAPAPIVQPASPAPAGPAPSTPVEGAAPSSPK